MDAVGVIDRPCGSMSRHLMGYPVRLKILENIATRGGERGSALLRWLGGSMDIPGDELFYHLSVLAHHGLVDMEAHVYPDTEWPLPAYAITTRGLEVIAGMPHLGPVFEGRWPSADGGCIAP